GRAPRPRGSRSRRWTSSRGSPTHGEHPPGVRRVAVGRPLTGDSAADDNPAPCFRCVASCGRGLVGTQLVCSPRAGSRAGRGAPTPGPTATAATDATSVPEGSDVLGQGGDAGEHADAEPDRRLVDDDVALVQVVAAATRGAGTEPHHRTGRAQQVPAEVLAA